MRFKMILIYFENISLRDDKDTDWGGNYGKNSRGAAAELTFNLKT